MNRRWNNPNSSDCKLYSGPNPTNKPTLVPRRGLDLPDSIPTSEAERTAEAEKLIAELVERNSFHLLTTWEVELVDELKQGKACTRVRLKELREALKRIREHAKTDRH